MWTNYSPSFQNIIRKITHIIKIYNNIVQFRSEFDYNSI